MVIPRLSPETERRLDAIFPSSVRTAASRLLLEQCGNDLPFLADLDEFQLERVRFAALKLSEGTLEGLRRAIELAKIDWRDLLMAAGFGHDVDAHHRWLPSRRSS